MDQGYDLRTWESEARGYKIWDGLSKQQAQIRTTLRMEKGVRQKFCPCQGAIENSYLLRGGSQFSLRLYSLKSLPCSSGRSDI